MLIYGDPEVAGAQLSPDDAIRFHDHQTLSWLATTIARVGDRTWARALYDGLAGDDLTQWCVSGVPMIAIEPPLSRTLGVLAAVLGDASARKHFSEALAALRSAGTIVLLVRTLVECTSMFAAGSCWHTSR